MNPTVPSENLTSNPLQALLKRWRTHPLSARMTAASEVGNNLTFAVPENIRAAWLSGLSEVVARPVVVVLAGAAEVERTVDDVSQFTDEPLLIPAWETLPYEHVSPAIETMGRRLAAFHRLASDNPPALTVISMRALLQKLPRNVTEIPVVTLKSQVRCDLEQLARDLTALGYERSYMVEARGEFAVRGGIVDIFPATHPQPIRVELWGDEIDTIRHFSVADQRSVESLDTVEIFAARELIPDAAMRDRARQLSDIAPGGAEAMTRIADGQLFVGMESWLPWLVGDGNDGLGVLDLVPTDALVVVCDPKRCLDRAIDLRREEEDLAQALAKTWQMPHVGALENITDIDRAGDEAGAESAAELGEGDAENSGEQDERLDLPHLFGDADSVLKAAPGPLWYVPVAAEGPDMPLIGAASLEPNFGQSDALANRLKAMLSDGMTVIVAADGTGSGQRVRTALGAEGLSLDMPSQGLTSVTAQSGGHIVVAPLSKGFISSELKLALLSESDITGRRRTHRKPAPARRAKTTTSGAVYGDLRDGDHVVHYHHGVGRFEGVVTRGIGGVEREYLEVSYSGHDKLYVPVDQVDAVRKYVGGDTPRLSRMGGSDWARTKGSVRRAVAEIAQELVNLYRQRLVTQGFAFSPDGALSRQLSESFPYEETPDQLKAIAAVSQDMEAPVPMDRLVCGDVGYGKTEISIRAAMKAVEDGKQVAVLVPTTVLAQQHFQTFSDRFADLPVRVEMLSRFLTSREQAQVVGATAKGEVDVVIGTHRLLQSDLSFPKLGLVVVDEEQRFGVKAKERLKELRTSSDILTMTATPIPRTLEFALTGIRDMSLVSTPPEERQPVLTYVGEFDEQAVSAAIRRELLRDGQVFYVHNRVRSIDKVARQLNRLVPEARIAVAHGQMDEGSLERIMLAFWDGEYDVLCSTTIIESGLDVPRANTLIVDRADLLGLSQLYQLRGRVGRARQRAYAYLFYPPNRQLSEEAHERLKVIAEHQDLGSGFAIAMRDLEMRGAGNLVGQQQSGHIAAVGFDLYCQLVNEAVATLKGETVKEPEPIRIDLPLEALIPHGYMPKESLRIEAYRRLGDVDDETGIADVRDEWQDRYGPLPLEVENLLELAAIKVAAGNIGVNEIVFSRGQARLSPLVPIGSRRMRLVRLFPGTVIKEEQKQVLVPYSDSAARGRGAGAQVGVSGPAISEWIKEVLVELA